MGSCLSRLRRLARLLHAWPCAAPKRCPSAAAAAARGALLPSWHGFASSGCCCCRAPRRLCAASKLARRRHRSAAAHLRAGVARAAPGACSGLRGALLLLWHGLAARFPACAAPCAAGLGGSLRSGLPGASMPRRGWQGGGWHLQWPARQRRGGPWRLRWLARR